MFTEKSATFWVYEEKMSAWKATLMRLVYVDRSPVSLVYVYL